MNIFWLIIAIVAYFFISFILMYCTDRAKLWENYEEPFLHQPSIYDLKDTTDKYLINKYVKEVVCPSYNYFILKGEIKKIQEADSADSLVYLFFQLLSLAVSVFCAIKAFPNDSPFAIGVATIVICFLGYYVLSKIYDKYFSIAHFNTSIKDLKQDFIYDEKEYAISEEDAFNNYVISIHYRYLCNIEETVRFRKSILKIISGIATIIYLLFFFRVPD